MENNFEAPAEIRKEYYSAAMPTFPVQDHLGQTLVNFGMNKLEYAAIALAAGWWHNPDLRRDTIASEAVNMAAEILKECDARMNDIVKTATKLFDLNANKP